MAETSRSNEIIDFLEIPASECPCGSARRALMADLRVPYSLHLTDISVSALPHYHKRITETYLVMECETDAAIELDGVAHRVSQYQAVVIPPGTRHRAVGKMRVVIVASPKFDPQDEWFD